MSSVAGLVDGFRARSGEKSFLDRLDDFRGRLIASLVVVTATTILGFLVAAWPLTLRVPRWTFELGALGTFGIGGWTINLDVLGFFVAPIEPFLNGEKLKYLSPTDPFFVTLKLALSIGLVLALPYLIRQLWSTLAPLMRPEERKLIAPSIVGGVVLFAVGVLFCYYLVVPLMLQFTMAFQTESLEQSIVIGEYLKLVLRMLVAFGLAFELPIVILLGTVLGIVTPELLVAKRKVAIAILTVASAIVTPPDIGSQLLLILPVLFLYEVSIVMSRAVLTRRNSRIALPEG
ncbi:MAG: twin-arginine translocase subunit TatC [Gemmatimonas sp.]|nr:twin-arginine translocase subunit TatC [Gemmatimonas sp.]